MRSSLSLQQNRAKSCIETELYHIIKNKNKNPSSKSNNGDMAWYWTSKMKKSVYSNASTIPRYPFYNFFSFLYSEQKIKESYLPFADLVMLSESTHKPSSEVWIGKLISHDKIQVKNKHSGTRKQGHFTVIKNLTTYFY